MKKLRKKVSILLAVLILGAIAFIFDKEISLFFYGLHNPFFDYLLGLSVYFQIPGIFMGLLILVLAVVFFLKRNKWRWLLRIVSSFVIVSGIAFILKEIVGRARPYIALGLEEPPLHALGKSFPSAHAAVVFAMLPFFEKEYPKLKYLWLIFAIIVCLVRIYFPVHYLSDILFGSFIGYLIGYVICNYKFGGKIKLRNKKAKR